jgi:cytochrome c oxidase subunit 2
MQSYLPLLPDSASTFATWTGIDGLYWYLVALTVFFTVGISLVIIVFAIVFRRKAGDEHIPEHIEGSMFLETFWTAIPFLISMTIFGWGLVIYYKQYRPPANAMNMYVVGKQWMWKFQHPTGQREINELHVPVNRKIRLTMTTEDVLHDLYFPEFRTKADVVPGRYTQLWFEATKTGTFNIFCAEYCGTNHSIMGGKVIVLEQDDYDRWLSGNLNAQSPVDAGKELFANKLGCASCHKEDGSGGRGPGLKGLMGKPVRLQGGGTVAAVDDNYLRESIENPGAKLVEGYPAIMPTFKGQVTEEQLIQLVAYIKSLSGPATGSAQPAATTTAPAPAASPARATATPATPAPAGTPRR